MYPGAYDNIDDLESKLSHAEMSDLFETAIKMKFDEHRFQALLQGAEMEDPYEDDIPSLEDIRARAHAKAMGITEEQYEYEGLLQVIDEDE